GEKFPEEAAAPAWRRSAVGGGGDADVAGAARDRDRVAVGRRVVTWALRLAVAEPAEVLVVEPDRAGAAAGGDVRRNPGGPVDVHRRGAAADIDRNRPRGPAEVERHVVGAPADADVLHRGGGEVEGRVAGAAADVQ